MKPITAPLSLENTLALRGLAALGVCLTHAKIWPFYGHGYWFVAIFFFFSGYGLMLGKMSKPNYFQGFIPKRLSSIIIPYYIATIIYIIAFTLLEASFSLREIFWSFVFPFKGRLVGCSWYICAICLFYLAFYAFFKLFKEKLAILSMAIFLIGYIAVTKFALDYPAPWWGSCSTFLLGILYAYKNEWIYEKINKYFAFLLPLSVIIFSVSLYLHDLSLTIFHHLVSLSFVASFVIFLHKVRFTNRGFKFFGNISFEFYMLHLLVLLIFNAAEHENRFSENIHSFFIENHYIVALLTVLTTTILSYGVHKLNQKAVNVFQKKIAKNRVKAL